jgi:hypothetical protein
MQSDSRLLQPRYEVMRTDYLTPFSAIRKKQVDAVCFYLTDDVFYVISSMIITGIYHWKGGLSWIDMTFILVVLFRRPIEF